eukprot:349999-Chlamydomonas_euryale.AAC.2
MCRRDAHKAVCMRENIHKQHALHGMECYATGCSACMGAALHGFVCAPTPTSMHARPFVLGCITAHLCVLRPAPGARAHDQTRSCPARTLPYLRSQ